MEIVFNMVVLPLLSLELIVLAIAVLYVLEGRGKLKPFAETNGEARGLRFSAGIILLMSSGWIALSLVAMYVLGVGSDMKVSLQSTGLIVVLALLTLVLLAMNALWRSEKKKFMMGYKKRSSTLEY